MPSAVGKETLVDAQKPEEDRDDGCGSCVAGGGSSTTIEERESQSQSLTILSASTKSQSGKLDHGVSAKVADGDPIFHVIDDCLPLSHLSHLRHVFRSSGPYWSEHDYDAIGTNASRKVGYFSVSMFELVFCVRVCLRILYCLSLCHSS